MADDLDRAVDFDGYGRWWWGWEVVVVVVVVEIGVVGDMGEAEEGCCGWVWKGVWVCCGGSVGWRWWCVLGWGLCLCLWWCGLIWVSKGVEEDFTVGVEEGIWVHRHGG